jgi:hypothetical protein
VSADLLAEAAGKARCGECRHVFNMFDVLYDDLSGVRDALVESRVSQMDDGDSNLIGESATVHAAEDGAAMPVYAATGWQQPAFRSRDILISFGILLLLVLLGVQWVWFNRAALAAEAAWRPGVEQFCTVLGCSMPLPADLARLVLVSRDVRQHPVADGALLINAEFESRAGFAQRYPVLEVSFTDQFGSPVAMRRFRPAEYLDADVDITAGMPSGARVQVHLEVLDPGETSASFQFEFL